ncbi:tyrosine-type recombinase/integrase [Micromonospora sp. NPDC049645]|uniref:tyrosine-type recombinase/integrase n=1 Tax=Micromonospora sp. NPDC049645 TaxID=3155508 RepID=UPI00341D156C
MRQQITGSSERPRPARANSPDRAFHRPRRAARVTLRARIWKPSLQRAGLPLALRFHDLRHSYATWLVSDGVPINDVAKVMGHEQTSTTLDRYTHSTRDRDRRVLASFAAFLLPQDER